MRSVQSREKGGSGAAGVTAWRGRYVLPFGDAGDVKKPRGRSATGGTRDDDSGGRPSGAIANEQLSSCAASRLMTPSVWTAVPWSVSPASAAHDDTHAAKTHRKQIGSSSASERVSVERGEDISVDYTRRLGHEQRSVSRLPRRNCNAFDIRRLLYSGTTF